MAASSQYPFVPDKEEQLGSQLAWGKVILLGEHSVVYGHPALAGSISRGVRCELLAKNTGACRLHIPAWGIDLSSEQNGHPVYQAFSRMLTACGVESASVRGYSNLPPAAGLGSSAALGLALARCLCPDALPEHHRSLAAVAEAEFHKQASGIDVALSQAGSLGRYSRENGYQAISKVSLPLVIALSGVPRSTAAMVEGLADRIQKNSQTRQSVEGLGRLSREGEEALGRRDFQALGSLMNRAHESLKDVGVSHPTLDTLVAIAHKEGALGAKLTGAGGGGSVIALAPGLENSLCQEYRAQGFTAFAVYLGSQAQL